MAPTSPQRLAVIGNGMVTASFLEALVAGPEGRFEITVFGAEARPAYDRIKLSTLLAGGCTEDDLTLLDRTWYRRHGVTLREACVVTSIDRERREIHDCDGGTTPYDVCVIATGSDPLMPPIEGSHRGKVHSFRTLADVEDILLAAQWSKRAVVIGGGLLGLEAAYGLRNRGIEVSVVHLMDRLMERQLDSTGAQVLLTELEQLGMSVHLSAQTAEFLGKADVESVSLRDGQILDADMVVVACGIRPNVALARDCGLTVNRAIVVDDQMRSSDPHIYAIGECNEHRGAIYGVVAPLRIQARVLAAHLGGDESASCELGVPATTLKVAGVHVFSAGAVDAEEADDVLTLEDTGTGVYKKVLIRDGRVRGAILVGDLATAPSITASMTDGTMLNGDRLALVAPPSGLPQGSAATTLPDDAVVCGCNGVTKRTIVDAIRDGGCTTRIEVTKQTRASGSCGSCASLVDCLLAASGAATEESAAEPTFCSCVPVPRRQLRTAIVDLKLRSVQAVLETLGNGAGCARCKPALSYVLDVVWCGDYEEDRSARFVNDRVHANIQNDGTFSVVPRMYGGVTSPAELRRIADVAERYEVPMIKVTGGQRLDLLGVRKQDLPDIWKELGMPSGHAYAKAVRTVKTCVGIDFCRFGVGDSTALGIALERVLTGLYTPHKLKAGVTGCPRNCAEITVKDLGVMAIATGWELYVGGAAGMSVRKADLLCTVATPEQALTQSMVFVQHYREEAEYLERTYHYLERVGIEAVRRATSEASAEQQEALLERFWRSKSHVKDPWATEADTPRTPRQFDGLPSPEPPSSTGGTERPVDAWGRGHELVAALPMAER